MIEVKQTGHSDPFTFEVVVRESSDQTRHRVTMSKADHNRLAKPSCAPERCIEAAFGFLLDREPKEAILSRFDIAVVSRYFADFESRLPKYIASISAQGAARDR